jgi:hypothetical protein
MTLRRRATRGNKRPHVERGRRRGNLPTPQAQKQNNPHTMRDKERKKGNALTEIARTEHRYVRPIVIINSEALLFPPFCGEKRSKKKSLS